MNFQGKNGRIGGIDEFQLNAYIDGELTEQEMQALEQALKTDETASDYVRRSRKYMELGRKALEVATQKPISGELQDVLNKLKDRDAEEKSPLIQSHPYFAIAASLLLLITGYGLGVISTERGFQQQRLAAETIREYTRKEVRSELNRVLEYTPSGTSVVWKSETHDVSAELLPLRTLKTPDSRYCREFREVLLIDGVKEMRQGLSCRVGEKQWETRMILPNDNSAAF